MGGSSNNKRNAAKGKNIQQQQQKAFNILMQVPAEGAEGEGRAAGWRVAGNVLNVLKNRNESVSQDEG